MDFDVIVVGGGPGGYVAAIRCAQLGFNTACVDKWTTPKGKTVFGGTCLNVGCIPSKALLESSYNYDRARHLFAEHGVVAKDVELDLARMQARKQKVVDTLTGGVDGLFKKNKVTPIGGTARALQGGEPCKVSVTAADGTETGHTARHLVIATGSVPRAIPVAKLDGDRIVDNEGALAFDEVPGRLGVIGAGVIGLELGSVWNRLGSKVKILEALPEFLPPLDRDLARDALKMFTKQGLDISLSAKVSEATVKGKEVRVTHKDKDGAEHTEAFDRLVVAVGRAPYTEGLGLEEAGIRLDGGGFVEIDGHCRTSAANVYAIGDVAGGAMLAHKAEEEGVFVAETLAGQKPEVNYEAIPWVIYTHPEIAWVGQTEATLKAKGVDYRKGVFPFMANGRARGLGETEGMVKLIADAGTDRLLGAQILGGNASDMIAEAVMAIEFMASAEDVARTVHAHPTLSEVVKEAALAVDGRAIHI